jgi:SAM-dependent methyltransferase
MDDAFRALLACPVCRACLDASWRCQGCGIAYAAPDDVPALRLRGDRRTEVVREFYTATPFPNYPPHDSLTWLRARAGRSRFARLLDEAIPGDARIVEIGCGTGQMSLYLARADRIVIGADLTRASLLLGAAAAKRFGVENVMMIETDLVEPGLQLGAFDVVYCSGVLHHTPDPRASFACIARLAKPGGLIVIGLYNAVARLPLRLRRLVARMTGERWIPWDPVLADRAAEPDRREAWLRDQYRHPEEHRHTLGEVRRWFAENDIDYVRAFPSALIGEEDDAPLFVPEGDGWWLEDWLAQLGWMRSLGGEGGLFVVVGRRASWPGIRVGEARRDPAEAALAAPCAA